MRDHIQLMSAVRESYQGGNLIQHYMFRHGPSPKRSTELLRQTPISLQSVILRARRLAIKVLQISQVAMNAQITHCVVEVTHATSNVQPCLLYTSPSPRD